MTVEFELLRSLDFTIEEFANAKACRTVDLLQGARTVLGLYSLQTLNVPSGLPFSESVWRTKNYVFRQLHEFPQWAQLLQYCCNSYLAIRLLMTTVID